MNFDRRAFTQIAIGSAAALGLGVAPARAAGSLVVPSYGGRWERFWAEQLLPAFTDVTGIETRHDVGSGANFVANLRAAGNNPPYSIFMGNENITTMLRGEGFFEPFDASKLPNLSNVYDNLINPGLNGVRGLISPIGLGYRTDLVETPPKRWTDLWDNPEFRGKIALYQIGNTAAVLFLLLTARIYGGSENQIDLAFEKVKELLPFQQVSWSGAAAAALVRGDAIVAPVDWGEVVALKRDGAPVDMVTPIEGVVAFEQSFNLIANGPDKDEAQVYLNYVLDAQTQAAFSSAIWTSPSNKQTILSEELMSEIPIRGEDMRDIISFDWEAYTPRIAEVADRWNREMV
ncbi:MAG: extracellular solute-binding protein [Rhodobacter sp.]|nr:extracellular solute-binding protein [Rhodobacter sp.]